MRFDIQNMYVAMEENEIIGIILWKKGPLEWSKEKFIQVAEKNSVLLSPYITDVKENYIDSYSNNSEIAIINVCISSK